MPPLKRFILLGVVFLLLALCAGVYVWYQLQGFSQEIKKEQQVFDGESEGVREQPPIPSE